MTQSLPDLASCSISALLDMGVEAKTFRPWFKFAALTQLLTLRVVGLVFMSFSRDYTFQFSEDTNVFEVECERRRMTAEELQMYGFQVESHQSVPEMTVMKVHGDLNITVICDSIEVSFEPLNQQYPDMV
jgi:hypothetical protein